MLIEELPSVEQDLINAIHQGLKVAYAKAGERAKEEHADLWSALRQGAGACPHRASENSWR